MAVFRARLMKIGNSVAIFIPRPIRDALDLQPGDEVYIIDSGNEIVIKKSKKRYLF